VGNVDGEIGGLHEVPGPPAHSDSNGITGNRDPRVSDNKDKGSNANDKPSGANDKPSGGLSSTERGTREGHENHSNGSRSRGGNTPSSNPGVVAPSSPIDRSHAFVESKGSKDLEQATHLFISAWQSTADVRTVLGHPPLTKADLKAKAEAAAIGAGIAVLDVLLFPPAAVPDLVLGGELLFLDEWLTAISAPFRGAAAGLEAKKIADLPNTVREQWNALNRTLKALYGESLWQEPKPHSEPSAGPNKSPK
jgi:hypothetical protein